MDITNRVVLPKSSAKVSPFNMDLQLEMLHKESVRTRAKCCTYVVELKEHNRKMLISSDWILKIYFIRLPDDNLGAIKKAAKAKGVCEPEVAEIRLQLQVVQFWQWLIDGPAHFFVHGESYFSSSIHCIHL